MNINLHYKERVMTLDFIATVRDGWRRVDTVYKLNRIDNKNRFKIQNPRDYYGPISK